MNLSTNACPLCHGSNTEHYWQDRRRCYRHCATCDLVFVPLEFLLSSDAERQVYDLHQNDACDAGYRRFLNRLCQPLCLLLAPGSEGLDFGCGPGPALARMLSEQGFQVSLYDPFYAPDAAALKRCYNFITCSEVVEHLYRPRQELERLWHLLRPGGHLGLMTKLVRDVEAFSRWHYKNDPTHVRFFSRQTFLWLARQWQAELSFFAQDVIILHKPKEEK
ncbi:MAG: class I SAM-dependent methyltransferase [Desulfuromonadaceae bacterium]|nr:class I SAM-dependent methyltransferase [Desulfuromonadaceae bacterium]